MSEKENTHQASSRQLQDKISPRRAVWATALFFIAIVLVAIGVMLPRLRARTTLRDQTQALAIPSLLIDKPAIGQPQTDVMLPGNITAYTDAPIFARTNGYLQKWYFDIGAKVKKGQLLAVITAPELDQQLEQAKGELGTAQANAHVAQQNATRYTDLLKSDSVSQQETENFTSQATATSANVNALQANVARLKSLQSYKDIYAPFDGVITARNVDVGQLIDAGAAKELFHLAAISTLRVYVNVPQIYSQAMKPGLMGDLTLAEFPGKTFPAKLVRTSNAIDPASRTLLVEFDVDNRTGVLLPGAFGQVHFKAKPEGPSLIVPVSALIFRSEGLRVATVGDDNRVHLAAITIGEDDGKSVQITGGLEINSRVIENPPDSVIEGEVVNIVQRDSISAPGASRANAQPAGDQKK